MDALTWDLVFTVLASGAALGVGGLGIALLPWKEAHWIPEDRPLPVEPVRSPSRP
ncbi:MAG: hypothetical protein JXB39_03445 [Deltaproteobacteria bacterium]|nr:hypothetical protein [Deltaproteobacteria bacterium]